MTHDERVTEWRRQYRAIGYRGWFRCEGITYSTLFSGEVLV